MQLIDMTPDPDCTVGPELPMMDAGTPALRHLRLEHGMLVSTREARHMTIERLQELWRHHHRRASLRHLER